MFCPEPVRLAYAMASVSSRVKALVFGSQQYPELSQRYKVVTVPKIWVNDKVYIDGAAPTRAMMEMTLVEMMKQALDESVPKGKFRLPRD
ncbi:MAG: thioredoxin family protein [bacterium]|nr:thioredoxin family protein [bacterium]